MARPTKYTPELANQICEKISTSALGLREICKELKISTFSVLKWLSEFEEFSLQYARAREMQADLLADEIIKIADTPVTGIKKKTTKDGQEITEGDMIEHRRLQVDARKWKASKLAPKKYGDHLKIDQTITNKEMTEEEIDARLNELLKNDNSGKKGSR